MTAPKAPQLLQRRVVIRGKVQGVGYRASTAREAAQYHGLRGWVRNLPDGCVEAVFCGEARAVIILVDWCRRGPPRCVVECIDVEDEAPDLKLPPFEVLD